MTNSTKHFLLLNLATASIATSGFLGKFATNQLSVEATLFWRCLFAVLALFVFVLLQHQKLKLQSKKDLGLVLLSGVLFSGHLYFYFLAISISSVAVAVISMFTFPIMTALLEPIWFKKKLSIVTVFSALGIFVGMNFMVPAYSLNDTTWGILFGLMSALCYTVRNLLSTSFVTKYSSNIVMLYQIGCCTLLFFISTWSSDVFIPNSLDVTLALIFLGVFTKAIGHNLFVNSFRHFNTSTASIITSLQPVIAIFYAYVFVNEIPDSNTYIGGGIILLAVIMESAKMLLKKETI